MKKIFLDTEFTDLVPGARLISIALIDEDEKIFYAELEDTYKLEHCSEFVKKNVLPYLKGGDYKMTYSQCALKIGNWIEDLEYDCIIASDALDWDMPYLNKLLEPAWPKNLRKDWIYPISVPYMLSEHIFKTNNLQIHNALDDALMMKRALDYMNRRSDK